MRYLLLNPNWTFEGSIYFGCRDPHLPLEFGYSKLLLERAGHEALLVDGQMDDLSPAQIRDQINDFRPDYTVITTAPSYLFWRCAPPELRVPLDTLRNIRDIAGQTIAVGPHASTTPDATRCKLGVDFVVQGECEELLGRLDRLPRDPYQSDMMTLPALHWPDATVARHNHHHHRFDAEPRGPGAEMETSRGCPYHCTFCAKDNFRNTFRRRPLPVILEELDGLLARGVEYVYFIDEIFLPNEPMLKAFAERKFKLGVQTRIDLWSEPMLDLLGRAGCVSIEAGVESITVEGRKLLDKNCKMSTDDLAVRLIYAKGRVPFVQANLLQSEHDDLVEVKAWREHLIASGVWSNEPVPLFPYPGSPDYTNRWGKPDDRAWERAHEFYLGVYDSFSDVQEQRPAPLIEIER